MPEAWKTAGGGPVTLDQLPKVALELIKAGKGLVIWLFYGEMGSGKTTLIRHVVNAMGVAGPVASPTFSMVNVYGESEANPIYHFDLYRLKNEMEALDFGFDEYLTSGNRCLIEWPEKVSGLLPAEVFEVKLLHRDTASREIYYRRHE